MNRRALLLAPVAALVLAGCGGDPRPGGEDRDAAPARTSAPARTAEPAPTDRDPGRPTAPGTLLVTDFGGDTVTFLHPERGPFASVRVGTAPYGLVVGADGRAWVATAEGVAIVDTRTRKSLGRVPYRTGTGPVSEGEYRGGGMGIALSPDGERVYVGVNVPDGPGVLEIVDTATREVTDAVPVGRRPFDVDVDRDGSEVYVTNHDSFDVTAVRADTLAARRHQVAPYGTEGGLGSWLKPHYAAVRADGRLLLPFEGERLAVLDPDTGRVTIEKMTADTHQHGAALTPDGTLLVVGTGPIGSADESASLTIRARNGTERVVPLDGPHEDVAVSRDGRSAYVTGGFTRDGFWDGITVVDLREGTTRRLPGGTRPLGIAVLSGG
ncbi:YncE family protein [Streptomyces jumonjinensis]|uniref:YncE family protein n=1 Tax=Streptomyces jumonjinensis TaxID=1945 RepID=A0A646KFD8_STRJU|nr:YncE family protein [Streptomyces jumonjinensis]MQT00953.1 YncE family protein [Streptomyces jumonjinensis]